MTVADRALLLSYRLRPLEPVTLVVAISVAIAAGIVTIPGAPPLEPLAPSRVTAPLTMVALGLAVTLGFVAGRDVDPAEQLLSSTPRPYRRALVLRVILWAAVLAAIVAVLGSRAGAALEVSSGPLQAQALVHVLFAGSLTLVLSRSMGSLAGGGGALTVLALVAGMPLLYDGFPVQLLATPETSEWAQTAVRLELLSAALLAAAYWRARP